MDNEHKNSQKSISRDCGGKAIYSEMEISRTVNTWSKGCNVASYKSIIKHSFVSSFSHLLFAGQFRGWSFKVYRLTVN